MSIRLDPRRLTTLKQLAAEADMRPGDLVRSWVEERIDGVRGAGARTPATADGSVRTALAALEARIAKLEAAGRPAQTAVPAEPAAATQPEPEATSAPAPAVTEEPRPSPKRARRESGAGERVALHDEMIAILVERGPMSASDLATAVAERGRYAPPRSGKPIDSAMISQRVSNPTYRARFLRRDGRIGLAD